MKTKWYLFLLLVLGLPAVATVNVSATIAPNPAFGENGLALTNLGVGLDEAAAIAVQPDGRILVAGTSDNGIDSDMALVRYLADGTEDPEFLFSAGSVIGAGFGDDGVRALSIDTDGTILLGGFIEEDGVRRGALVRVLSNGQLDYTFGDLGVVAMGDGTVNSDFYDITILADRTIVLAGDTEIDSKTVPVLARFLADGSVDSSFGTDGVMIDSDTSGEFQAVAAQADGTLLAGGFAKDATERRGLYLARFTADGTIDKSFGDEGRAVVFEESEEIVVHDIAIQSDNKVVAVGEVIGSDGVSSIMIARFAADGSPDTELSKNGVLVYDIGTGSAAYAVAVAGGDLVLAAGYRSEADGKDTVILRFGTSSADAGTDANTQDALNTAEILPVAALSVEQGLDPATDASSSTSIQQADLVTTSLSGSDEVSQAIAVLPDGTVYTAGSSGSGGDSAIMVASYTENVASGEAINKTGPVVSQYYSIETAPITDITRVGALTGGTITQLVDQNNDTCITDCEAVCEETDTETDATLDDAATTTCKSECTTTCTVPTIDKRGVVYSVKSNPEYDAGQADTGTGGSDTGTTVTDTTTTTNTDSTTTGGTNNFFNFDSYFVKSGQTEDGDGVGEYSSEIADVNPQTTYYVRAYALLSDGTVIYGQENVFKTNDSCFIATAAFGGIDDFAVLALRQFRDRYLKPYNWGQQFIRTYYHFSPPIADIVAQSLLLRALVMLLLLPVVAGAMFMLYIPLAVKYALLLIILERTWNVRRRWMFAR